MNRLECYQAACVALDTWACGGAAGRAKTDPVYQMVTEGRDVPASYVKYSSCADRAHWRLWRLGCRRPFVNREERTPQPKDFHWGVNIAWLHDLAKGAPCLSVTQANGTKFPTAPKADWEPTVGDELLIWNTDIGKDAHSLSIVSFDGGRAETANYGAGGMSAAAFPGAKLASAPLVFKAGAWQYGEGARIKKVMRVLRLVDIIETLTAKADLSGPDFDSVFTGEVRDFIEAERA